MWSDRLPGTRLSGCTCNCPGLSSACDLDYKPYDHSNHSFKSVRYRRCLVNNHLPNRLFTELASSVGRFSMSWSAVFRGRESPLSANSLIRTGNQKKASTLNKLGTLPVERLKNIFWRFRSELDKWIQPVNSASEFEIALVMIWWFQLPRLNSRLFLNCWWSSIIEVECFDIINLIY